MRQIILFLIVMAFAACKKESQAIQPVQVKPFVISDSIIIRGTIFADSNGRILSTFIVGDTAFAPPMSVSDFNLNLKVFVVVPPFYIFHMDAYFYEDGVAEKKKYIDFTNGQPVWLNTTISLFYNFTNY